MKKEEGEKYYRNESFIHSQIDYYYYYNCFQGIMFEFESKYHITRPMVGGNGVPIGSGTDALHQPGSTPVGIALRGAISGNASGLMGAQMGGPGNFFVWESNSYVSRKKA